ncbi:MAG TPA: excisionase [Gammaproteobacteria bacterium]|nr:excisionase [Gammaproteobacteria bacterium]
MAEVAALTGLGRTTLFKLVKEGRLQATRIDRRTLITHEAIVELLKPSERGEGA